MNRLTKRAATAVAVVAVAWVAIGGAAGVASAHAEFQQSTVSAGATTTLTLDVPNERPAPRYTATVRVQVPAGWSTVGCTQPDGWTCSAGDGEIAFQYAGGPQQEAFSFTLLSPGTARTTTFPVVQIYDNAENVLWSNTAVLQVAVDPSPSPPTSAPTPSRPTSVGPGPTPPADSGSADARGAAGSSTTSSPTVTDGDSRAPTAAGQASDSRSTDPNDGSPIVLVVLGAIMVLAIGTVIALVRRRS
jgi:hypothetical protein